MKKIVCENVTCGWHKGSYGITKTDQYNCGLIGKTASGEDVNNNCSHWEKLKYIDVKINGNRRSK